MAYGNGDKKLLRKALPAGSASLDTTSLPAGKLGDLALLRQRYLSVANDFVDAVFTKEPLKGTMSAKVMESVLVAKQKQVTCLNKAYAEKARLSIPSIIGTVEKVYLGRIFGRLAHCASPIPATAGAKTGRKYFNIPEEIQDQVSPTTLQTIEEMVKELGFKGTVALMAKVAVDGDDAGLDQETTLVLRAVHAGCLDRYRKPVFGADPRYTCQIHLDYRVIRGEDDPAKRLDAAAKELVANILVDGDNKKFRTFLEISNPLPRGKAIRLPVTMSQGVLQKFDKNATLGSLIVEIGQETVQVRTVASKELPEERDINSFDHFVSRDFGYKNTVSLTVLRRDREIDPDEMARLLDMDKTDARAYLEGHSHPMDNIVDRVRFSGQGFLAAINDRCQQIENLSSQISLGYNKLERLKANICGYLDLETEPRLADDRVPRTH